MSRSYKAVIRRSLGAEAGWVRQVFSKGVPYQFTVNINGVNQTLSAILKPRIEELTARMRRDSMVEAREQLKAQSRADHLLNLYLRLDPQAGQLVETWVFSDRNTAVLFKLSRRM